MVLMVSYDLHEPGRDYSRVINQIKEASGGYFHAQGSLWFIDTTSSTGWWRDELKGRVDGDDVFIVARLYRDWAGFNMSGAAKWLNASERRW